MKVIQAIQTIQTMQRDQRNNFLNNIVDERLETFDYQFFSDSGTSDVKGKGY